MGRGGGGFEARFRALGGEGLGLGFRVLGLGVQGFRVLGFGLGV